MITLNGNEAAIWNVSDGSRLHLINGERGDGFTAATMTPDEKHPIAVTLSGRILTYPLQVEDLIQIACARVSYLFH